MKYKWMLGSLDGAKEDDTTDFHTHSGWITSEKYPDEEYKIVIMIIGRKKPGVEHPPNVSWIVNGRCENEKHNNICNLGYACDACPWNKDKEIKMTDSKTYLVTIENCPAETTPDEIAGYISERMLRITHAWELDPNQKTHFLKVKQ